MFTRVEKIKTTQALALPSVRSQLLFKLKNYLVSALLIWLAVVFYYTNSYYQDMLRPETRTVLLCLALAYTFFGLIYYLATPAEKLSNGRGLIIVRGIRHFFREAWFYLTNLSRTSAPAVPKLEQHERTAILFALVKIFFLPLMLNFLFGNFEILKSGLTAAGGAAHLLSIEGFNQYLFPLLLALMFFIDVAYFSFGYLGEARFLNNTVRSVEPTMLGWAVALVCYPPFNNTLSNFTSWYPNEYVSVASQVRTFVLHMAVLILMAIYAAASVALGAKASNLTNRGIVGRWPYNWVRHPAYTAKNLAWWVAILPVFSIPAILSMMAWSGIYFLRAVTEERHLSRDPDYLEYAKQVRYRFIPGVW